MAGGIPDTVSDGPLAADAGLPFWRVPWEFAVHGIVGTVIFGIIAGFAVGLDLLTWSAESQHWLPNHHVSNLVMVGLKAAEYGLFASDLTLYFVFLWRTSIRTVKSL